MVLIIYLVKLILALLAVTLFYHIQVDTSILDIFLCHFQAELKKKIRTEDYHMEPPKNYLHAPKVVVDKVNQVIEVSFIKYRNLVKFVMYTLVLCYKLTKGYTVPGN